MARTVRMKSGLSSRIHVRTPVGHTGATSTAVYKINDRRERLKKAFHLRREQIAGLSFDERQHLADMEATANNVVTQHNDDDAWVDESMLDTLPPGEEGMFFSNAGGEEELCREIFEDRRMNGKRKDTRTRSDRTAVRNHEWQQQRALLVEAYMEWQSGSPLPQSAADAVTWEMVIVTFFETTVARFNPSPGDTRTNQTLARHGYLGAAPVNPTVAISFKVLEAYRQLHRACPRLSIQAQVRALCYLHLVPFDRTLADQFSIAFDVYLDILHDVDVRVNAAMKRDTPNWRMLNTCPPCLYVLDNEPSLKYSLLVTMDGNQSLKLVDDTFRSGTARADTRTGRSDMWLSPEDVDRFRDEVHQDPVPEPIADEDDDIHDDMDVSGADGPPSEPVSVCVQRWRNAGPEARKKMFALFAATGIFVCLCRHGHLLIMCDMIRSGELMKYPLALVDKLMQVYGNNVLVGYDIACAFSKTLARSSLGARAKTQHLSGIVPAFHGHSHNRGCQVNWHPMYVSGAGKEDFEGCERCFSESNALASGTRLASAFHRHQAIEQHFAFWDQQKHAESGNFIYNNYRQALEIIIDGTEVLNVLSAQLRTGPEDYENYLREERAYLEGLKAEPPDVARRVDYMAALGRLYEAHCKSEHAKAEYNKLDYYITRCGYQGKAITQIKTLYRTTYTRWLAIDEEVRRMEEELAIPQRWYPGSPEYEAMAVELSLRNYRRALDSLERLVVQRLFELTKLGMSGVGYKLREKIGKALKTRADAIKRALAEYNRRAAELVPPRAPLSWTQVIEMVSVGDFDILRDARQDIRTLPWAQPLNRRAMNTYFNILRAREEIERLNVEISRLFTFMIDEHCDFYSAICHTIIVIPPLARELSDRWLYRDREHRKIVHRLHQTSQLPGFTGSLLHGRRVGRERGDMDIPLPSWACYSNGCMLLPDGSAGDDEHENSIHGMEGLANEREAEQLIEFFDNLGIQQD